VVVVNVPLLEVSDLHLSFAGVTALEGVGFSVEDGELFAIIGPNGAGKTSIFNCLNGVYRPQQGSILLGEVQLIGKRPNRIASLGVARTFQNIELFEHLTVLENIMLGRHIHVRYGTFSAMAWFGKATRHETMHRERAEEIIDFLEIEAYRKSIVAMLPYGVQKRVELGRALAMDPALLLLDKEELGIAMILVEHDMGLVMDIADRIMVLDFGRKIAEGTPFEVQRDPDVIRAYLGEEFERGELRTDRTIGGMS
jgi:branched-chain amino acid transport system ATP-binding protein